jgi:DNA-binding response OmpR family regulator
VIRAVVIESNKSQELMFRSLFSRRGITVDFCSSVEEACNNGNPISELLVYIWGRGSLDQFSIRRLRNKFPGIPIVIASAHAFAKDRFDAFKTGIDDYLVMPFTVEEFDCVLNNWVSKARRA